MLRVKDTAFGKTWTARRFLAAALVAVAAFAPFIPG
jgi:hypothetical protein